MSQPSRSGGPALHAVYASQRDRVSRLVDAEVAKLSRRQPELPPEVLADVRATLWRISRHLFLGPLTRGRVAPAMAAHLLALDDIPTAATDTAGEADRRRTD